MVSLRDLPHVVIIGAGFGGLTAAKSLAHVPVRVTLVDRTNHHLFQPLLYQVAMAGLSPADIAAPIRMILRNQRNASVVLDEASGVDPERRLVRLRDATLPYDYLVVATGGRTSYFGHDDWESFAPGLKDIDDAIEIRRRVLLAFEAAEKETDPARRSELLTFVVVGGGPTGVELAGALAELARFVLADDFRHIDPSSTRIILIEGGSRILESFTEDLSASAARQLARLGVTVRVGQRVTHIDETGVQIGGEHIRTSTVLWGAGVVATSFARALAGPVDRGGRVLVDSDLTVPGQPLIFAIGDMATFLHQGGKPLPGVSPVAIQMGRHAARNIARGVAGRAYLPFHYVDRGSMATVGRSAGIAQLGRLHLDGMIAWLTWLLVHIYFLIGFRNRIAVLFNWAWSYFTYERGARLITGRRLTLLPRRPAVPTPPAEVELAPTKGDYSAR
jgi:NADH dehydrogenase